MVYTTNTYHLTILEARSLWVSSRYWQSWFLLGPVSLACRWRCSLHIFTWSLSQSGFLIRTLVWLEPTSMTLFCLNYLSKDPISKYCHILGYCGLGLQQMNLGGCNTTITHVWYNAWKCCNPFALAQGWVQHNGWGRWIRRKEPENQRCQRCLHCSTPCQLIWLSSLSYSFQKHPRERDIKCKTWKCKQSIFVGLLWREKRSTLCFSVEALWVSCAVVPKATECLRQPIPPWSQHHGVSPCCLSPRLHTEPQPLLS